MKINVLHIAKLASLKLNSNEVKKFETQLSSILDYIKKLQEVKTERVETTSQVTGLKNVTKKDETEPSLSQEEILSNAKSKHNGFFKTKAILES